MKAIEVKSQPTLNCTWGCLMMQYLDGKLPVKELLDQTDSKQLTLNIGKEEMK